MEWCDVNKLIALAISFVVKRLPRLGRLHQGHEISH